MSFRVDLDHIAVVLYGPRISENVGAAARAAWNMGIKRIVVVSPESYDRQTALKLATHAAAHVVDSMAYFDSLEEALRDFELVVGTTSRKGGTRRDLVSPREIAGELVGVSRNNNVALLFGPEDRGLTNDEIRYCDRIVTIPTAKFRSLNLAQAVMILCYEIFVASQKGSLTFPPKQASFREKEAMFDHLKETLVKIGVIDSQNPEYRMINVRRSLNRNGLLSRDAQIIRGLCRQIDWYVNKRVDELIKERLSGDKKEG
jgi:tRNA/rRNA methyltransferase